MPAEVRPYGIDVFSGVRENGALNRAKKIRFVAVLNATRQSY